MVITAWRRALRRMGWKKWLTAMTPLWEGSWLAQVSGLKGFREWDKIGLSLLGDVTEEGVVKPYTSLQADFNLHRSQLFKYLHLRHTLTEYRQQIAELADCNPLEARLLQGPIGRGGISKIYRTLVVNSPECFSALRARWEGIGGKLEEEDWRDARMAPRELAISSRLRFIQIKYLHMAYRTPLSLNRMYSSAAPCCPKRS